MAEAQDPWLIDEAAFPQSGDEPEVLRYLLQYAILAPSGHNTQPWLFHIAGDCVAIRADRTRALPVVDPDDRELTMSCGAALETLCVAMRHFGYTPAVSLFPDGNDADLLATVRLGVRSGADADDALFRAIPQRRTVRQRFDDRRLPERIITELTRKAAVHGVTLTPYVDAGGRERIANLVAEGDRIQFADPRFRRELASWIHSRRAATRDGLSGASFGMPDVLSSAGALIIRTFDIGSRAAAQDQEIAAGSPLLGLLSTPEDRVEDWLATGRALALVLLRATAEGVRASYLNQPIEVADLRPRLTIAAGIGGTPQLLLRFGYGPQPTPSARRPLSEVILA